MPRSPDEIFKAVPRKASFSVWFDEQKARYVETHPESRQSIDRWGTIRNRGELERFFVWLDLEYPSDRGDK